MRIRSIAVLVLALPACSGNGNGGNVVGTGGVLGNAGMGAGTAGSGASPSGVQGSGGASSNGGSPDGSTSSGGSASGGSSGTGGDGNAGAPNGGTANSGGSNAGSGGSSGGTWWKPAKNATFYWDLENTPPDNTRNVGAYDIDGWGNSAQEVSVLHARGIKVVCYMDAGTYEPDRPDSADFPASLEGTAVQGWPGELWLDVRPSGPNYAKLQSIMLARFEVCQQKGFDAVEPDNLDSYENSPGFTTTAADQLAYNEWLATTVHGLGMAIFQKNDVDQVQVLEPYFDGILDEECNEYSECDTLAPYTAAGKPAWDAEYTEDGETTDKFCNADVNANITGALFDLALDGSVFQPCSNDVGILN
jgi:Glycoside-hydrolase family GH114